MTRHLLTAIAAAFVIYGGCFYAATRPWEEPDW